MYVFLNDKLVLKAEAMVSVYDHGFLYGDGVYETLRSYEGIVFMLDEHLARFYRSAGLIGLSEPPAPDKVKEAIYTTLKANALESAYVRITLSRGPGPIGLDPELCREPTFVVLCEKIKEYPESFYAKGMRIIVSATRRNLKEALDPRIKSLNFLNNILAKIEAKNNSADEAVMLNAGGFLAEGTVSNLFFFKNGILCTPSVECGILDGITRGLVLELASREGFGIREGFFTPIELQTASSVFITNTSMELMPVCQVDTVRYPFGSEVQVLHEAYRREVKAYIASRKAERTVLPESA